MLSIEFGGGLVYLRQRCAECILRRLPRNWTRVARAQTPTPLFGDQKSVKALPKMPPQRFALRLADEDDRNISGKIKATR